MEEKEVDLRDYIKVILKRKRVIFAVFFIAVIAAVMVSLIMPRVYQSTASIMITPSRVRAPLAARAFLDIGEGEHIMQRPAIALPTHQVLLKATPVLERIIYQLRLVDERGEPLTLDSLSERLDVKGVTGTNILELKAEANDPGIARKIANAWAEEYIKYSQELILGAVRGTGDFIAEQFDLVRESLIQAEKAVKDFRIREGLSLAKIKLREKQGELNPNYANTHKLEFQLARKRRFFQRINEDIMAMTKDGVWLGSFSPRLFSWEHFIDKSLSPSQHSLRQETLETMFALEEAREKYYDFVNVSGIKLLRQKIVNKRRDLLNDKSLLAEVKRLAETTEANLKAGATLDRLKRRREPIARDLIDSTVWEILSLTERHNFFKSRQQFLKSKIEREGVGLRALEKTLFAYENELETLRGNLSRAKTGYNFYLQKFKSLEVAKNSTKSEIATIEFQLSQLRKFVEGLKGEVETLRKENNRKEIALLLLTRQAEIYKRTYGGLSIRVEEARIAKAVELGEVKIVSPATEPENPIRPRRRLIVAISGLLSLMMGIFLVFFMEFWQVPPQKLKG